jgi:hypothetical protein
MNYVSHPFNTAANVSSAVYPEESHAQHLCAIVLIATLTRNVKTYMTESDMHKFAADFPLISRNCSL